jgi:hypothetical protein
LNYSQNFFRVVYRPLWRAESRCDLHLSIAPLVVALQRKSTATFEDPEYFCPPTPPPLWTIIRTSWKVVSGPLWCAESVCTTHLSIAALVAE